MRILKQSLTLLGLGGVLAAGSLAAQTGGGTGTFKWYVGGNTGITSFRSTVTGREFIPAAGGHLLITAKRTGLLLSVDQGFGPTQQTNTMYFIQDSVGTTTEVGVTPWTFQGIRRYSAMLLAYPVRNQTIQPFIGVGGGIMHTTRNSAGPFVGGSVENALSSGGFVAATAGLEFRVGPLSAFGQYQITTKQGYQEKVTVLRKDLSNKPLETRIDTGEWTLGAFHTLVGGLRFSLGNAKDRSAGGGY
ncbi:MAG TPA: hypothetical protein VD930_08880 [Gemmatimonadales bacterium]|nr:hypothetical protein [Gemmatimonadales bacterium]